MAVRFDRIKIQLGDIVKLDTDAVVNAANWHLAEGSGVCGAIFRAAGSEELTRACDAIGGCETGSAVITPGFGLKAKYIIHAVGPVWRGGKEDESELLSGAYEASLNLAKENGCHSIGFPLISAGIYGYPLEEAWEVAVRTCMEFVEFNSDYDLEIIFTVLDKKILMLGEQILRELTDCKAEEITAYGGEAIRPGKMGCDELSDKGVINWLSYHYTSYMGCVDMDIDIRDGKLFYTFFEMVDQYSKHKEEVSKISPDEFRESVEKLGIREWKHYYSRGCEIMDGGDWELIFSLDTGKRYRIRGNAAFPKNHERFEKLLYKVAGRER